MKIYTRNSILTMLPMVMIATAAFAQSVPVTPGATPIQAALVAHHAWAAPPVSMEITGTSTRGGVSEPVKITATRQEEVMVEYGTSKRLVATQESFFKEDGEKLTLQPTRGGFMQLDITGLFLLAQLSQRPVTTGPQQLTRLQSNTARRIHVDNHRTETHYARLTVSDEFDLYIDDNGLLSGLSRSFYQNAKPFDFTLAYTFAEYRDTNGVLLPYRIEKFLKGQKVETIDITQYRINVPTSPMVFQPRRPK